GQRFQKYTHKAMPNAPIEPNRQSNTSNPAAMFNALMTPTTPAPMQPMTPNIITMFRPSRWFAISDANAKAMISLATRVPS
ncbi:MAG TPA: hypothetical protein VF988_04275, partial [Verrucomicrobiae bacterium]